MLPRVLRYPVLVLGLLAVTACEQNVPAPGVGNGGVATTTPETPPSVWRTAGDSDVRVLESEHDEADLAAAIARARKTLDEARIRWQARQRGNGEAKSFWAVKWRAPTVDGGAEYVWVEPMTWSAFRVEGRLASPPQRALACGKSRDDLVGFSADELVDWVRYDDADFGGAYEGGFTIAALDG